MGGLVGFAWGFVDGLFSGAVFSWLYNWGCGRAGKIEEN